jgi:hypothetical protein
MVYNADERVSQIILLITDSQLQEIVLIIEYSSATNNIAIIGGSYAVQIIIGGIIPNITSVKQAAAVEIID